MVGLSLLGILLVGAPPGRTASVAPTTYDNVQIFIHTTNSSFSGTYDVTAFNSTGYALVTYETPYPAASFELPSASYIFTVTATTNGIYVCPLTAGASSGASGGATATSSSAASAVILPPCLPGMPKTEYGYAVQQVSGPVSLTISTKPVGTYPTEVVSIHVQYVNGTAAAGTNLYASVLGGPFYTYGVTPLNMSAVTGKDGNAKLTIPVVPVEVTAWKWVHVVVPTSRTSTQVTVGGENVNVTANVFPSFVGLAGSTLIVPPQTSATIVLHSQQPSYWATPEAVSSTSVASPGSASSGSASSSSGAPDLVPQVVNSQQASSEESVQTSVSTSTVVEQVSLPAGSASTLGGAASNYDAVLLTVVGALALGLATASIIIVRNRPGV